MHSFLHDIVIAVIAATATGLIFYMLRQPVIIAYLIAGIIIGPEIGPQLVKNPDNIQTISEIGLCLLLFIIGLEISPDKIKQSGKSLLIPGAGQFILSVALGAGFFLITGFATGYEAAYLAAACALSSTAVVLKSLYDAYQLDTLHGRITLGILVMQDIWAVLALITLPNAGHGGVLPVLTALGKTAALFAGAFLVSRYMLKFVFEKISRAPEMTVTASIGWCAVGAGAASAMGLSPALGALAAGVSIATFPYHVFVIDKVQPLRDVFLMLFFVSLGMKIPLPDISLMVKVFILTSFLVVSRFTIIYPLVRYSGGSSRTGFLTSLNLAQASEFSLVIMMAGLAAGQVSTQSFSLILYTLAFTAIGSSYAIKYGYPIHAAVKNMLRLKEDLEMDFFGEQKNYPIIILGYHRGSQTLIEMITKKAPALIPKIMVIDYNAEILKQLHSAGIAGHLGDISRAEVLEQAGLRNAKIIISTIPAMLIKGIESARLIQLCRIISPDAAIIASADFKNQIEELKNAGASKVILPYFLAGEDCADFVIDQMGRFTMRKIYDHTPQS